MADPDWRSRALTYGPYALLLVLFALLLWIRLEPAHRFITSTSVVFSGNDPWYHSRMVQLAVHHWPVGTQFDPWSYFPYGTGHHSGFGGLFDQIIATTSLILGLGHPTTLFVELVTVYAPAVFGALTVVPAYLIARELTDRWSALLAGLLLVFVNGQFLTRTIVGVSDHSSAEALFQVLALAGFIYAFRVAYLEKPTRHDVVDRNWRVLRRPVIAAVGGGIALGAYLMLWPPGVFLLFGIGAFVVIQLSREHLRGQSTEYLTFAVVTSFVVAGVLTLLYARTTTLSSTAFSLLQPLTFFVVAIGSLVIWWLSENLPLLLSKHLNRDTYDPRTLPATIGGLILIGLGLMWAVFPEGLSLLDQLLVRIYSFGLLTSPSALTVAEIQPATLNDAWFAYALLFPLAILGLVLLAYRIYREDRPVELLVLLWGLTIFSAYFTMIRFGYYMGVTVAILSAYAIWYVLRAVNLHEIRETSDVQTFQLIVLAIVVIAVVPGNVIAVSGTSPPAWQSASHYPGANTAWQNELRWVNQSTPPEPLNYYGRYKRPPNGDFPYPPGAYGVMSWWDYGHWITYTGHRIPDANPFQQGPKVASAFLLAQNETRANLILDALPAHDKRQQIPSMTVQQLQATVDSETAQQSHETTRYVMIDDQMAAGKFGAIATWTGPGPGIYFGRGKFQVGNGQATLVGTNSRYRNTMLARLYFNDASGLSHYRLVHETRSQTAIVSVARKTQSGWTSDLNGDGRLGDYVNRRLSSGVFNAVQGNPNLAFYDVHQVSTVKTFERVPGATFTGQVDTTNATTIWATVPMRTNTGRNFTYVQTVKTDGQGRFSLTVPYATTNTVGPTTGGTDSGVTATGSYTLFVGNPFAPAATGTANVPEPAIYGGTSIPVTLTPVTPGNNTASNNVTVTGANSSAIVGPSPAGPAGDVGTVAGSGGRATGQDGFEAKAASDA